MPIIKSAIKRARQAEVRHKRLVPYKTNMKTMIRKVQEAAKAGADTAAPLSAAFKAIDTAAKKKIIHRNTADRRKAMLARVVAKKK